MATKAWVCKCTLAMAGLAHVLPAGPPPLAPLHLVRVPAAEIQKRKAQLDSRLLPLGGALVAVDDHQVFRLDLFSGKSIIFVPAVYELKHGSSFADCGIFLLSPGTSPARFLSTLTHEQTLPELINCGGVQAMGLMPADGSRPRVLLLYNIYSPNVNLSAGVALAWDEASQNYKVDRILDDEHEPVSSIADMRAQLSAESSQAH